MSVNTVGDLIAVLQGLDPSLPLATHANNHTAVPRGPGRGLRVSMMHVGVIGSGFFDCVLIGNQSKRNLNGRNERITAEVDGGPDLPDEWRKW